MKTATYSKTTLISLLRAWVREHGETPSRRQWSEDASTPSDQAYRTHFGSWGAGLRAAGLEPKKSAISPQCRAATIAAHRGKRSCAWKGGRIEDKRTGYILLWKPEHPNANVGKGKGYVAEHRFVMAEHLGRPLQSHEFVHHRNGKKGDNRLSNLQLVTKKVHLGNVECPHCGKEFVIR